MNKDQQPLVLIRLRLVFGAKIKKHN